MSMRSEAETSRALSLYGDTVRRICIVYMKNYADAEDIYQDVFLKYMLHGKPFQSEAHEKAWIIRVAINACKDSLKRFFRSRTSSLSDMHLEPFEMDTSDIELLDALRKLPEQYRTVLYLFYYEGYTAVDIANMLHRRPNTIYTWLDRAKKALRQQLGGDMIG